MSNEADTCRTYIVPKLHASGWEDDFITEQTVLTYGRIVQSVNGEELRRSRTLMPSVLDRAFKSEL
jgi:type I restriction enzyme, R subunit